MTSDTNASFDWKNPKWEDYKDIKNGLEFLWGKDWLKAACGHIEAKNYALLARQKFNADMLNFAKERYNRELVKKRDYIKDLITEDTFDPYINKEKLLNALTQLDVCPSYNHFKDFEKETARIVFSKKIFGDKIIENLQEFMRSMKILAKYQRKDPRFYRGESQFYPTQIPSLFRRKTKDAKPYKYNQPLIYDLDREYHLIQHLTSEEPEAFATDTTLFEKIVRSQHYAAPTRLLDITTNPLIALYFACQGEEDKDGYFYIFTLLKDKVKYHNDPLVSLYTALMHLSEAERLALLDDDNEQQEFVRQKLLFFAKADNPALREDTAIDWQSLNYPLPVLPRKTNQRLRAQHGAFLLWGIGQELATFESIKNAIPPQKGIGQELATSESIKNGIPPQKKRFRRYIIPGGRKKKILEELDRFSISKATLFPELENSARIYGDAIRHSS